VGEPLFLPDGNLNEAVGVQVIRDYVAYTENIPQESRTTMDNPVSPYLLGQTPEAAWLFHYEPNRVTLLDMAFLENLQFGGKRPPMTLVYADACLLQAEFMQRYGLIFKKIPRDITRL
jgi:adenine-specific DNA-methyltransferase